MDKSIGAGVVGLYGYLSYNLMVSFFSLLFHSECEYRNQKFGMFFDCSFCSPPPGESVSRLPFI